eukprot:Hpha_TRINITY_DN12551_c0_g1::TRINITY_DN12551_c0_g1_i1::g.50969::m.50969/K09553/STIP1; stress-induced-phosphoprotein 1
MPLPAAAAEVVKADADEAARAIIAAGGREGAEKLRKALEHALAQPSPKAAVRKGYGDAKAAGGSPPSPTGDISQRAKEKAEKAKAAGNKLFSSGDNAGAMRQYNLAVNLDPANHIYRSNRSAARAALSQWWEALEDAQKAIELAPEWGKGYSRAATALQGLRFYHLAAQALQKGVGCEPGNETLKASLKECQAKASSSGFSAEEEKETMQRQMDDEKTRQLSEAAPCAHQ